MLIDKQVVVPSLHVFNRQSLVQEGRTGNNGRIYKSLLSSFPQNPLFDSHQQTWHSVVCNENDKRCRKMDNSPWSVWYRTCSTRVISDTIVTWKIMLRNIDWDLFQDSDITEDQEDSKSFLEESFGACSGVARSYQWVGHATSNLLTQFHRVRDHFLRRWIEKGLFWRKNSGTSTLSCYIIS